MLFKMVTIVIINLCLFYIFGVTVSWFFKIEPIVKKEIFLIGFFAYYGVFQIAAESMILLQSPFTHLVKLWLIVLFIMLLLFIGIVSKNKEYLWRKNNRVSFNHKSFLWLIMVLVIVVQLLYMFFVPYNGWDTGFYVGTMNTTIQTNTMYIFSGTTGKKELYMNLRYALSSFYMQETIWCYLFDFHPMLYHSYVSATILTILSACIYYVLGKEILKKKDTNYSCLFVIFCVLLNFINKSDYTVSDFFLKRSGEAKAYLGNLIIPVLFWIIIRIWNNFEKKENWIYLFLIALSCNTISMSSMLIVPTMITIGCAAIWGTNRKGQIVKRYCCCMIFPVIFLLLFYLYWKGLFIIRVK